MNSEKTFLKKLDSDLSNSIEYSYYLTDFIQSIKTIVQILFLNDKRATPKIEIEIEEKTLSFEINVVHDGLTQNQLENLLNYDNSKQLLQNNLQFTQQKALLSIFQLSKYFFFSVFLNIFIIIKFLLN